ncbi:hypothetical protein [Altererythrobacter sp. MF3-039]|uniref:hypothetical protein n=1 Tax=Altererythrobacter sp. MF3-039 TaxID=3252901 RepID=UPI00390C9D77
MIVAENDAVSKQVHVAAVRLNDQPLGSLTARLLGEAADPGASRRELLDPASPVGKRIGALIEGL